MPPGEHLVSAPVRITTDGSGLHGPGRIVQTNPAQPVLEIEDVCDVTVSGITLTRAEDAQEATAPGLLCRKASHLRLQALRVDNCKARDAAITLRGCAHATIRECEVRNYKRIAVDDRTDSALYGYAFHCIDGTGILVEDSVGTVIESNRVLEQDLLPTEDAKKAHSLGRLCEGRQPSNPGELGATAFKNGYVSNWHQGSAIVVTSPETTRQTIVRGNYLENAAQGIDLHCDHAIVKDNLIDCAMIGIKATHGCRNLIISGNLVRRADLWGILLNPGAASHAVEGATGGEPAKPANVDAGTIVSGNIITDYGYGHEFWNWGGRGDDYPGSYAIALFEGQLDTNPPLRDILVSGNIVYNTGRDGIVRNGKPRDERPRYRYAVYVGPWGEGNERGPTFPQDIVFADNIFHPGIAGVSTIDIP